MAITENGTVRGLTHRVLDQLDTFPAIGFNLPVGTEKLTRIAELLEAPLDPQFRELFALGDGETHKSPGIFYGLRIFTSDEIIALLEQGSTPVGWLPFAGDQHGRMLGIVLEDDATIAGKVTAIITTAQNQRDIAGNLVDLLDSVTASLSRTAGYPEVLLLRSGDAWSAPYIFGMNDGSKIPAGFLEIHQKIRFPLGSGGTQGAVVDPVNPLGSDYLNPLSALGLGQRPIGEAALSPEDQPIGDITPIAENPIGQEEPFAPPAIGEIRPAAQTAVGAAAAAAATALGVAAAAGASAVNTAAITPDQQVPAAAPKPPAPRIPTEPTSSTSQASEKAPFSTAANQITQPPQEASNQAITVDRADAGILASLQNMPGLRSLSLPDLTPILEQLSPLGNLKNLKSLSIESAYQPVLNELRKLGNLEDLTIKNSYFYALNFIKSLPNLNRLDFVNSTIQDATALGKLRNIRSLNFQNVTVEKGFDAIVNNPAIQEFTGGTAEQLAQFNRARGRL